MSQAAKPDALSFQDIILTLQRYWADLGCVVEDGAHRHAAEELEHVPEPLADALGGLAPEDLGEPDVGVRERDREEVAAGDDAAHAEVRLPEVDLALAREPVEQEEPLRLAGVELGGELLAPALDVPLDGRVGALEAFLPDEAVVDPLRGVALLEPAAPVLQQPRVDQLREGLEQRRLGRPADRRRPLGEVRLPQVLPHRGLGDPGVPGDRGDGRPVPPELSDIVDLVHADHFLSGPQSS